jgi:hypothetical protein
LWKADTLLGKLLRGSPIGCIHRLVETGKDYLFDGIVFAQFRGRFADRDLDSEVDGEAVDATTDGWEGQSPQAMAPRQRKTGTIATGKQLPFSVFSAMPHRANGMNDKSGGQAITFS